MVGLDPQRRLQLGLGLFQSVSLWRRAVTGSALAAARARKSDFESCLAELAR